MAINWEIYRDHGTMVINLVDAYDSEFDHVGAPKIGNAIDYLNTVHGLQPIKSRQAAAIAVATAHNIAWDNNA